jgi:hypothetical protein
MSYAKARRELGHSFEIVRIAPHKKNATSIAGELRQTAEIDTRQMLIPH